MYLTQMITQVLKCWISTNRAIPPRCGAILVTFNKVMEKSILLPQDSEDSNSSQESEQSSQDSQSSEAMQSSQEEIEQIDPWDQIHGDVLNRHEARLNALIKEYEQNGDSPEVARVEADNAMLPVDRKELRNVLFGVSTMDACDSTFRKSIQTQEDLKDTEEYEWLESTELAIDKRKFLLNRLFVKQPVPGKRTKIKAISEGSQWRKTFVLIFLCVLSVRLKFSERPYVFPCNDVNLLNITF